MNGKTTYVYGVNKSHRALAEYSASTIRKFSPNANVLILNIPENELPHYWKLFIPDEPAFSNSDRIVWVDADTEIVSEKFTDVCENIDLGNAWVGVCKDFDVTHRQDTFEIDSMPTEFKVTLDKIPYVKHRLGNTGLIIFNMKNIDKGEWARRRGIAMRCVSQSGTRFTHRDQQVMHMMSVPTFYLPSLCNDILNNPEEQPKGMVHYTGRWYRKAENMMKSSVYHAMSGFKNTTDETMKGPSCIVSITSHGERLQLPSLNDILSKMSNMARKIKAKVCLTVYAGERIPVRLKKTIEDEDIEVIYAQKDYGVNLKWIEVARRYKGLAIIMQDDDIVLEEDAYERMLLGHIKHPNAVIARLVRKLMWFEKGKLCKPFCGFPNKNGTEVFDYTRLKNCFPENVGGTLIPPQIFCCNWGEIERYANELKRNDDLILHILAIKARLETWLCPAKDMFIDDLYNGKRDPVVRRTSLWQTFGAVGLVDSDLEKYADILYEWRDL